MAQKNTHESGMAIKGPLASASPVERREHPGLAQSAAPGAHGGGCCGGKSAAAGGKPGAASGAAAAEAKSGLLIDLGNTKCPVMGGKPDGTTYSEWRGLRVGHCCGGCTSEFATDPEASLERAGIAWRDAAAAVERFTAADGADRPALLSALERRWTVVRRPATTGGCCDR